MNIIQKFILFSVLPAISIIGIWAVKHFNIDTEIFSPTAILPDSGEYYGGIKENKFDGNGKIIWSNKQSYEGEFKNGLYSGYGHIQFANGDTYKGEFSEGLFSGNGRLEYADGSVYKGQFVKGLQQGTGKITYWNNDVYAGNFAQDFPHGKGKYTNHNSKDSYEGEFVKFIFTGSGVYEDEYGNKYIGNFKNWKFHGDGVYYTSDGSTYTGIFDDGNFSGKGIYRGYDSERYEGEFEDWMYDGKGELIHPNGDKYIGEFSHGSYHGEGAITYAKAKNGITEQEGKWEYGRLQNKDKSTSNSYVEKALYNQNKLMRVSLENLLPSRDNHIDIYYVGVAGWGKQDVFMKEVEYVKDKLDRDFDTKGRSINLINNKKSIESHPLATITSIEHTLNTVASMMDSQEDILFLFLTSHGSKKHKFSLEDRYISIPDLSAEKLAEIVNKLPIKWKVIVVSSCYSGGFLKPLKNEHTLIMTAASATEKSFGCSDQAEMTYFGKALFKESIATLKPFEVAFDDAKKLIIEWEKSKNANSNPQIHKPVLIRQHMSKWRNQIINTRLQHAVVETATVNASIK